eukprot:CAMPEP_0178907592 /NCGR_PEP_ID=MMETSP0786-20121207/7455_1 /TAXON_ID=186022 /ORGANISM="Thalassionema frauenfeldii, Strain CCMP 1798" /LENGTH=964 /DNA_ID=CAMNT_0020579405 /DNA_START=231 /DNA_END=3125 /DNA_ORIENTATION=+
MPATSLSQSSRETTAKPFYIEEIETEGERRILGSQELLMLPRQYKPKKTNGDSSLTMNEGAVIFPQMNHVSCAILSKTPAEILLRQAIDETMRCHPLLRAYVEGDGEPEERIDAFQMVRKGDPNPCTFVAPYKDRFSSDDVLSIYSISGKERLALDESWQKAFERNLDDGSWCTPEKGPLWKIEFHRLNTGENSPCALIFSFNHAISDQTSANKIADQILTYISDIEETGSIKMQAVRQEMPLALEDSILGKKNRFSDIQMLGFRPGTLSYVAGKAAEGFKNPVILPDGSGDGGGVLGALATISGNSAGGRDQSSANRKSTVQFRTLSSETVSALLSKCREKNVSISNALTAAMTLVASDFVDNGKRQRSKRRNYKVLQSLDMRRFGKQLDKGETSACMAGSMDLIHGPILDRSGEKLRNNPTTERLQSFWNLAAEGRNQTTDFIDSKGPRDAVRVFDFAMTVSDMNNLVHLTSESKSSQGRAYSAGVSNVGVYERQKAVRQVGQTSRDALKNCHGDYKIEDVFFATSHARTGCLYQLSAMTIGGELKCTFHPASPIVCERTNEEFADAFIETLEIIGGIKEVKASALAEVPDLLPPNLLPTITAALGAVAIASHSDGLGTFYNSVMEMKANVDNTEDFWAALNFWIFFAVGHPILQPILWISDVLHGSPGPLIADLVPATFIAGNIFVIAVITLSKEIRNSVNIAALCAFLAYVGAGLDGQAGLADFNLALDDPYAGKVVNGCPAYEKVRQASMENFDLQKYQGLWYEQKFHDWTQFKEVYDTTLDIKLTADGEGWIDDFAVKGPSEKSAPLSWDKSPVANGAHYFLFGKVDKNDPKGVLRESGFGVTFPNYIVDVKKDPETGEYTEAIQFQCLERGGVRVFEGINFLSRKPQMTDEEMSAMHARAKKAGMYPYGASPEQMHTVARRPSGAPEIDNSWQAMWKAIGVDKLLELVTESIEDGGR